MLGVAYLCYVNNNDSAVTLGVAYLCYVNNNDRAMTLGVAYLCYLSLSGLTFVICLCQEEVQRTMQAMKQKSQSHHQPARDIDDEENDGNHEDVGDDIVDERWKKQRYTSNQLRKKLDAVSGGVTASCVPVGPAFVLFFSVVHVSFSSLLYPAFCRALDMKIT